MKMMKMKRITGKVIVKTGLHIGGGDAAMEIGGMDNPIIRNPANNEPYIPGSSLKGKMRSLMEWHLDCLDREGRVHKCTDENTARNCPICRVFGISASEQFKVGPTRLIVRDCCLSEKSRQEQMNGQALVEDKSENTINRITAMANPRPVERVIPGVEFDLDISFKILDMNDRGEMDEKNFRDVVLKGLALLEADYLGGGGTRGNGRIEFTDLKDEDGKSITLPKIVENAVK